MSVTRSGGATGRLSPSWRVVYVCVGGAGEDTELLPSPALPGRTRASRSLGASQPRLAAGPGSPAVPALAGVGAAASMTPARSGPACPVHLDKLRLTGAQSLWSRRPPDASLPTQLPRAGSGQMAGMGGVGRAGGATSSRPAWWPRPCSRKGGGDTFPGEVPGSAWADTARVAQSPVFQANAKDEAPPGRSGTGRTRPLKGGRFTPEGEVRRPATQGAFPPAFGRLPRSFGDPITLGAPDY